MADEENNTGSESTSAEVTADATTTFSGVFPVHDVSIKICTTGRATATTADTDYKTIADIETASISIDTTLEQWKPLDQGGWSRALVTGKSFKMSFSGKRNVGDAGNNYIAGKSFAVGTNCNSTLKIVFPDGWTITADVVISVSEIGTGDSTNVGPLKFDLTSDGKPTTTN